MRCRVLLLEDDPIQREGYARLLGADGHSVVALDTPEQVLVAGRGCFSCVGLVDPWGPSHEVLDDAERGEIMRLARAVPTILMSTRPWLERETAAGLGLVALVSKQAGADAVRAAVREVVGRLARDVAAATERLLLAREAARGEAGATS